MSDNFTLISLVIIILYYVVWLLAVFKRSALVPTIFIFFITLLIVSVFSSLIYYSAFIAGGIVAAIYLKLFVVGFTEELLRSCLVNFLIKKKEQDIQGVVSNGLMELLALVYGFVEIFLISRYLFGAQLESLFRTFFNFKLNVEEAAFPDNLLVLALFIFSAIMRHQLHRLLIWLSVTSRNLRLNRFYFSVLLVHGLANCAFATTMFANTIGFVYILFSVQVVLLCVLLALAKSLSNSYSNYSLST